MEKFLKSVVLIDKNQNRIAKIIAEARPDLDIILHQDELATPPEEPFGVITFSPGKKIEPYQNARWIHCSGAGVDQLLEVLDFNPEVITRTLGNMGKQISEYILAYLLYDSQKIHTRQDFQRDKVWRNDAAAPDFIHGKNALILGTGGVGVAIADAFSAMGLKCSGLSASGRHKPPFETVYTWKDLPNIDTHAFHIVVSALPFHRSTYRVLNKTFFQKFRKVVFFSVGRGQVVDESALIAALNKGSIRMAVLDVFESEPLSRESALWSSPSVFVTPHISGLTRPEDAANAFLRALAKLENGETPSLTVQQDSSY